MNKPFTDGISMQMVRCSHRLLDVIHVVQLGHYLIFKTLALITVNVGQNPIDVKPVVRILVMVSVFWSLVTNARLNLVKALFSTKIFSVPSLDRSTFKKSIQNRSRGILVTSDLSFVCGSV